jgi:hypothetical protein
VRPRFRSSVRAIDLSSVLQAIAKGGRDEGNMTRNGLIALALLVCTTIVVAVALIRHVNNKQDAAWCHDHGYANYATNDGFCVGAGGKLIKIGL